MAKWLHWGNRRKVVGEPPARPTLTDLSSGLLEPQGKPDWGTNFQTELAMRGSYGVGLEGGYGFSVDAVAPAAGRFVL